MWLHKDFDYEFVLLNRFVFNLTTKVELKESFMYVFNIIEAKLNQSKTEIGHFVDTLKESLGYPIKHFNMKNIRLIIHFYLVFYQSNEEKMLNAFKNNYNKLNEQTKWLRGIISYPRYHQINPNSKEIWEEFILFFKNSKIKYGRQEYYCSIYEMTKNIKFLEEGTLDQAKSVSNFCKFLKRKIKDNQGNYEPLELFLSDKQLHLKNSLFNQLQNRSNNHIEFFFIANPNSKKWI